MSSTGLDANIPEIWTLDCLDIYHNGCVMRELVNKDYEGEIKQGGDTVHVNIPGAVTLHDYTRESTVVYETLTTTKESMTIAQQKNWAFRMDALDIRQLKAPMFKKEREEAALTLRDAIDTRLLSHYINTDATNIVGGTGANAIPLTKDNVYDYFVGMMTRLRNANARGRKKNAVVPPEIAELITLSPEFRNRSTSVVDDTIQNGLMAKNYGGFSLHVSTNLQAVSGSYPLMFFTEHFISFAEQVNTVEILEKMEQYYGPGARGLALYDSKVFTHLDGEGAVLYAAA
jgi:hypothetical protein